MWNPINISGKNWLSFKDFNYSFQQNKVFLIQGENRSDDGSESNGSGKSSFQEAIYFCLTGNSIRNIKDNELIRLSQNDAELCFVLTNSKDNSILKIIRKLNIKKSSILEIYINDILQDDKYSSVLTGNKFILELIGISLEDIQNHFIVSQDKHISFFDSSDTKKKELISRFSKTDKLTKISDIIKVDVKVLDDKLITVQKEQDSHQSQITLLESQIESYQNNPVDISDIDDDISVYLGSIEINEKNKALDVLKINEANLSILSKKQELTLLENNVKTFEAIDYSNRIEECNKSIQIVQKTVDNLKASKKLTESELDEFDLLLRDINKNIQSLIKCPNCNHEFLLDSDLDIK